MTKKTLKYLTAVLVCCDIIATAASCSDTWDNHLDGTSQGVENVTLWQAIEADPQLSNFASVVRGCGYDRQLDGSQVFTVFAPNNAQFSAEEANRLIETYSQEKPFVADDDNSVVKEFLQNHIAMYNHSVAEGHDTAIVMMNGKSVSLSAEAFAGSPVATRNRHLSNGILFTIGQPAPYAANIFEQLRKVEGLDSVAAFFFNPHFYHRVFVPERSVAGGLENGRTVYLDSVFTQENTLFGYDLLHAQIANEDSTYWMLAPDNAEWQRMIGEYSQYFVYDGKVAQRDSLSYTMPRMAIMGGTAFSRTLNTDEALADSALSTNAVEHFNYRQYSWGTNRLHYYQYGTRETPIGSALFDQTEPMPCSNGVLMKSSQWPVSPLQTFHRWIIVEAEGQGNIREVSKMENENTHEMEGTVLPVVRGVGNDNTYYNKVWGNAYVEFEPARSSVNHTVTFNLRGVLSNIGYDIYLVTAPALANDSNATDIQRLPTRMRATIGYHNTDGEPQTETLKANVTTTSDVVDYILLKEDFRFPVCTYALNETEPQTTLTLETRVGPTDVSNGRLTRTMRIDCIMLVPHGTATVDDERFTITPHGDGETFFWMKQ